MNENKTTQAVETEKPNRRGFLKKMFSPAKLHQFGMMLCMALMLCVGTFAADGAGDTITDTVTMTALLTETGVFTKAGMGIIWSMIVANPVLEATVGVGALGLIFGIFRKAKRASRF